jgi:hypothetical protein
MHKGRCQVVFHSLKPDFDAGQARANLAGLFKIEEKTLERLLGTCPCVVKKGVDRETAERAVHAMDVSGALSQLEAMVSRPFPDSDDPLKMESPPEEVPVPQRLCPKCEHPFGPLGAPPTHLEEYPACGIVVAEYLQLAGIQPGPRAGEDLLFPAAAPPRNHLDSADGIAGMTRGLPFSSGLAWDCHGSPETVLIRASQILRSAASTKTGFMSISRISGCASTRLETCRRKSSTAGR